jgi:Tol biopolymer transport system component
MDNKRNLYFSEFADNMYVSECIDGKYQNPVNLKDHFNNLTFNGHCPFISPEGDYLIFADSGKLYISFKRDHNSWTDRIDLGDDINSSYSNGSPKVSHDGKYLFFQSTSGDKRPWGIYWVSSDIIHKLKREIPNVN